MKQLDWRFTTIRRRETTKSSATFTWMRASCSRRATAYNKAIAARSDTLDCFYRRGVCTLLLGDAAAALPDLEMAVKKDPEPRF